MRRTWKGKVGMIDFAIPRLVRSHWGRGWVELMKREWKFSFLTAKYSNYEFWNWSTFQSFAVDECFCLMPLSDFNVSVQMRESLLF